MRLFLGSLVFLGGLMVLLSAFLVIDRSIAPDTREAVRSTVGDAVYDMAEAHDARAPRIGRDRSIGGLAAMLRDLNESIFKSTDLDVAAAFPPAPEGWERRPYATADGEAITGAALVRTRLATTDTNALLLDFEEALRGKALTRAVTYASGAQLAAIRISSSLEAIRRAEAGENAVARVAVPLARIEGVPVALHRPAPEVRSGRRQAPPPYRHFSMDLDGQVRIDLVTNAPTPDALALLGGIDFAGLHADLPVRTADYRPGTGVAYPAGTP